MSVRWVVAAAAAALAVASLGFVLGRQADRTAREPTTTRTVTREVAAAPVNGDGSTLPAALAARARPRSAELYGTWSLTYGSPVLRLIDWHLPSGPTGLGTNVLEIWRAAASGWTRIYERRRPGWIRIEVEADDVTNDGIPDALVTHWNGGTGYCGDRLLLSFQSGRVHELFRRNYCERKPEIVNGMLLVGEPIGDCPHPSGGAHCYGGLRTQVLGWDGRKRVVNRTFVRCFRQVFRPERLCRRGA